jgi:hypothetical protein
MTKNKQTFSIRETAEILVPDKFGRTSYVSALFLIIVMISMISLLFGKMPPSVPLYFTLPWGEARLAPKGLLYLLPSISMAFLAFNLGLGRLAAKLSPLLPRVLAVSTAIITCMMLISLFGIIQSLVL